MNSAEVFLDGFDRIHDIVHLAMDGLSPEQLACQVEPATNSIAWLTWHLSRVQDTHIGGFSGEEQIWTAEGWMERFGFPFPPEATGRLHTAEDVSLVVVDSPTLLSGYLDAVCARTASYLKGFADADFDRIVDVSADPPVALGPRLMRMVSDNFQHAGQAVFVRGMLDRR